MTAIHLDLGSSRFFIGGNLAELFRAALHQAGLDTDDAIHADGRLHRFHVEGDRRGSSNGWYVLHPDGIPSAAFGHWRSGIGGTWRASIGRSLTRTEQFDHRARMDAARALRLAEVAKAAAACRARAASIWGASRSASADHPYLARKEISVHGTRIHAGCVVVPVTDIAGTLKGLQFIAPDGTKRFLSDTEKAGCFHALGCWPPPVGAALAVAEGFATAATVAEATGWTTVAAFDAGNLLAVARALREALPTSPIVIAADNDRCTAGNPGLSRGLTAAQAVGGSVIAPAFGVTDVGSDWNDFRLRYGHDATRTALLRAGAAVQS
ncbi:toprim domain-containing protein [Nevskia sp.]|uniref:toprim domain-containing protein n=1 Tax=Nevskia sp. TaxID=1929292 RepID=UPI0025EF39F3|nr:toprim domain-containing protein [Nevskia sp.]